MNKKRTTYKPTVIDYTLKQFHSEAKHRRETIQLLDKIVTVMEKFENMSILHDYRIKKLEKKKK